MSRWGSHHARVASLLAVVVISTACSSVQTYGGSKRPDSEVAILEPGKRASILAIDGRRYSTGGSFALLPGNHQLELEVFLNYRDINPDACVSTSCNRGSGIQDLRATRFCPGSFDAKAGHRYRIVLQHEIGEQKREFAGWRGGFTSEVRFVDLATQESVSSFDVVSTCRAS